MWNRLESSHIRDSWIIWIRQRSHTPRLAKKHVFILTSNYGILTANAGGPYTIRHATPSHKIGRNSTVRSKATKSACGKVWCVVFVSLLWAMLYLLIAWFGVPWRVMCANGALFSHEPPSLCIYSAVTPTQSPSAIKGIAHLQFYKFFIAQSISNNVKPHVNSYHVNYRHIRALS